MPSDLFPEGVDHWHELIKERRPTMHEIMLMRAHGTKQLPPQKPDWLDEYEREYDEVWEAVELIVKYGAVIDDPPNVPLTQEQYEQKETYESALKEWKQRHPRVWEDWSKMTWGYTDPKDMVNE